MLPTSIQRGVLSSVRPAIARLAIACLAVVCLALLALLPTRAAIAAKDTGIAVTVDPVGHSDNYSAVMYDITNGLPTSEANAIAQTDDGFVWIGSYGGLVRHDGNKFERLDSTTGVASVVSLLVDSRDRLWIGTNDTGVALMENGEFRMWGVDEGLASAKIGCLEEGGDGTIYIGTAAGIATISPDDLELRMIDDPRIADAYVDDIVKGSDGLLYCLTNQDDLITLRDGKLVEYTDHTHTNIQDITCILPDPDNLGKMYFGTAENALYYGDLKGGADLAVDVTPLSNVIDIQKFGNQVWMCSRTGIGMMDDDGFHYLDELPMNNSVNHVMVDYEGNLWFSSSRQGVMKVAMNQFSDLFARYGLPGAVVNSTCAYDGKLFMGMDDGLVVLDEAGPVPSVPLTSARTASGKTLDADDLIELLDGCRIRSIVRDSEGRMWIAVWRNVGVVRYDHGEALVFYEEDGLLSNRTRAVCETPDGAFLVTCTGGVSVIEGDRVVRNYSRDDGIENIESLSTAAAPNGDIVLGTDGGGIYVIGQEGTRHIGTKDGLASETVMRIKYDPARRLFWIVTSNSIAYMTEDYQVTTVKNFPYSNNYDLYENSNGDMWVLSSNGIYVTPTETLLANDTIEPVHYGLTNGLPFTATGNSYSELTEDGDLYIAGNSGVVKVNIDSSLEDITNVKQAVPYIDVDGRRLFPDETGGFTIPSDAQKLTIYGVVFSYSLTDPQVSYLLEGFDREATTVAQSKLEPVSYTNLPGGSYSFVMELKDALGRGSKVLSVPIEKEMALHERTWFRLAVGLGAAAILIALSQVYWRRRISILEKEHKEEAERERVNHELQTACQIQGGMLPSTFPAFPERNEFDLFASMEPAREVGGDFYDFFLIDDDHLAMVIADVSDKGIPAALFMTVSKSLIKNQLLNGYDPAEALTRVNLQLCDQNHSMMFVTVWLAVLELSTGKGLACNAGHENPGIRRAGGDFELLRYKHNLFIGAREKAKYQNHEFTLLPGDCLFVYTDGVPEAANIDEHMFGEERLVETLNQDPSADPETLVHRVQEAVHLFADGATQSDDITMLCMKYHGPQDSVL